MQSQLYNNFRSFVEAVGDQELKSSFIYMSPIRHTLAFGLSKSLYMFNSVLKDALLDEFHLLVMVSYLNQMCQCFWFSKLLDIEDQAYWGECVYFLGHLVCYLRLLYCTGEVIRCLTGMSEKIFAKNRRGALRDTTVVINFWFIEKYVRTYVFA